RGSFGRGAGRRGRLRRKWFEVTIEYGVDRIEHRQLCDGRPHLRTERILSHCYTEGSDACTPIIEYRSPRHNFVGRVLSGFVDWTTGRCWTSARANSNWCLRDGQERSHEAGCELHFEFSTHNLHLS